MNKVIFSISKKNTKNKGVGYLVDNDLLIASVSSKNTPYIRVFEDITKYCYKVSGTTDQYKGIYEMILNCDLKDDKDRITTKELTISYYVWYKIIED